MKISDLNRLKRCVLYYEKIEGLLATAKDSTYKHTSSDEKIGAPGHRVSVYRIVSELHQAAVENLGWLEGKIHAIEEEDILTR